MVNILLSDELESQLKATLPLCKSDVNIITAFCKISTLKMLDSLIKEGVRKRILVRFLPSDISSGATDKEIYKYCKDNNWLIYVDHTIHAKTYIFDKLKCILGSANATNRGIGISDNANKEASAFFEIDDTDYSKILTLYRDSIVLDDELYNYIISCTDDEAVIKHKKSVQKERNIECLLPEDFPDGDMDIIELYNLKSYRWLVKYLSSKEDNMAYFGELSSKIHDIFVKDPRPFRKDIKMYLAILIEKMKELDPNIIVSRPNYSECLQLKRDRKNIT